MSTLFCSDSGGGPGNPNQLKLLTFISAMITLERWGFPSPFTSRDKVSDHATRRLDPDHIRLGLVPPRVSMQLELIALRHQVAVYQERVSRPKLQPADRLLWVWLSRL
jgi:hypothetical protein